MSPTSSQTPRPPRPHGAPLTDDRAARRAKPTPKTGQDDRAFRDALDAVVRRNLI